MIKLSKIILLTAIFTISAGAMAEGKIAVFNAEGAILNTETAQAQLKEFEANANFAAIKAKAESLSSELQNMDKQLKNEGVTWSDEQKTEHRKKMEYTKADFDLEVKKLQAEQQSTLQRIVQGQQRNLQAVVQDLIKSEGIGLLLLSNPQIVLHADSSFDITAKITDRLNSLNKQAANK